jgi:hypothetical protein
VDLRESHFIPAGVYKILRDDVEKNPHPWVLTDRSAVQTSRQMTASLLCGDCEQLFSRNGERWVLGNCLKRNGTFPLRTLVASQTPVASSPETQVYYAAAIPDVNIPALSYFALSIFWRGSVHAWRQRTVHYDLGPFQEKFRQYLVGATSFPTDCALLVALRSGKDIDRLTYPPIGSRRDGHHVYKFPMPGLGFSIAVGRNIPQNIRDYCLVNGPGNPIIVTNMIEDSLKQDAAKLFAQRAANRA